MNIDIVIWTCRSNPRAFSNPAHATFVLNKLELKYYLKYEMLFTKRCNKT